MPELFTEELVNAVELLAEVPGAVPQDQSRGAVEMSRGVKWTEMS